MGFIFFCIRQKFKLFRFQFSSNKQHIFHRQYQFSRFKNVNDVIGCIQIFMFNKRHKRVNTSQKQLINITKSLYQIYSHYNTKEKFKHLATSVNTLKNLNKQLTSPTFLFYRLKKQNTNVAAQFNYLTETYFNIYG